MRKDMAKVIVERPRRGHADGYRFVRHARKHDTTDDAPHHEGMRRPHVLHGDGKSLNENLRPLERFLNKQVGRPWNNVYAEISENLDVTSAVQAHVRQHLPDLVAMNVFRDELDQLHERRTYYTRLLRRGDLYVDDDGILKRFRRQPKIKIDPGMKRYVMHRVKVGKPQHVGDQWLYDHDLALVEEGDVATLGISTDDIVHAFRAGTRIDAELMFEKLKKQFK